MVQNAPENVKVLTPNANVFSKIYIEKSHLHGCVLSFVIVLVHISLLKWKSLSCI